MEVVSPSPFRCLPSWTQKIHSHAFARSVDVPPLYGGGCRRWPGGERRPTSGKGITFTSKRLVFFFFFWVIRPIFIYIICVLKIFLFFLHLFPPPLTLYPAVSLETLSITFDDLSQFNNAAQLTWYFKNFLTIYIQ